MNANTQIFIEQAESVYDFIREREEAITRTKVHTVSDFKSIITTVRRIAEEIIVNAREAAKRGEEIDARNVMGDLKYLKRVSVAGKLEYEGHTTDERYHAKIFERLSTEVAK